ncbi:hypothetical protein HPY86_00390 [candidate division WOR-3 bacterium]|nr:hypothetical protein [candidate division WOR-3 bacterium]
MKGNKIAAVFLALLILGCSKAPHKVENKVVVTKTQTTESLPDIPPELKYPNASVLNFSASEDENGFSQFYIFRTTDSLPVVKKFYDERVENLFQDVECSSSFSDQVIVNSYRKMKEDEKVTEGLQCILVKEKDGTLGTLIYWQRQDKKAEL